MREQGPFEQVRALVVITRPANALMACCAVWLGAWLAGADIARDVLLLLVAAATATAFGNVVNDICDVETDRISHPERPLPRGVLRLPAAVAFAVLLAVLSVSAGFAVSRLHGAGTVGPIILLLLYSLLLKGVPVAGNVAVGLLVAYPLIYGGLGAGDLERLWIPAGLAFLLNVSRELIKDVEDQAGDSSAGIRTSSVLPVSILKMLVALISFVYLALLFQPVRFSHFGMAYAVVCTVLVLPVHVARSWIFYGRHWRKRLRRSSLLLKLEMVCGLIALAADELLAKVS